MGYEKKKKMLFHSERRGLPGQRYDDETGLHIIAASISPHCMDGILINTLSLSKHSGEGKELVLIIIQPCPFHGGTPFIRAYPPHRFPHRQPAVK